MATENSQRHTLVLNRQHKQPAIQHTVQQTCRFVRAYDKPKEELQEKS